MTTDQEEAPAWQRQYGQGAERDSWSGLGMVSRNREWDLLGRNKLEQGQRDVPSPVWINRAGPGTGIKLIKFHFRQSALALDWVCPAGLNSWSVTLLFNRTILNVLSLCEVKYPGSLLPLP